MEINLCSLFPLHRNSQPQSPFPPLFFLGSLTPLLFLLTNFPWPIPSPLSPSALQHPPSSSQCRPLPPISFSSPSLIQQPLALLPSANFFFPLFKSCNPLSSHSLVDPSFCSLSSLIFSHITPPFLINFLRLIIFLFVADCLPLFPFHLSTEFLKVFRLGEGLWLIKLQVLATQVLERVECTIVLLLLFCNSLEVAFGRGMEDCGAGCFKN